MRFPLVLGFCGILSCFLCRGLLVVPALVLSQGAEVDNRSRLRRNVPPRLDPGHFEHNASGPIRVQIAGPFLEVDYLLNAGLDDDLCAFVTGEAGDVHATTVHIRAAFVELLVSRRRIRIESMQGQIKK